jgi:hypothetical protein
MLTLTKNYAVKTGQPRIAKRQFADSKVTKKYFVGLLKLRLAQTDEESLVFGFTYYSSYEALATNYTNKHE